MSKTGKTLAGRRLTDAQNALLAWYSAEKRQLPWRETQDPYRIWVSEIMLQQTRVAAVIEYYHRFLTRFPDVNALASAREEDVLAAWSGLGYYRRARAMHAAAKRVVQELDGSFPRTLPRLLELPGIGRYTAAAVASIAFGDPAPVVDGNVERVLSRVLGKDLHDRNETWLHAEQLLRRDSPGDWNQAMMELGATVCTPRDPKCLICPVRTWCAQPGRPTLRAQGPRHKRELTFGLARRGQSVYMVKRGSETRLMAGMWELPAAKLGVNANEAEVLHRTKHSITNSDYRVTIVAVSASQVQGGTWIPREKLVSLPLTGLTRKVLRATNLWPAD